MVEPSVEPRLDRATPGLKSQFGKQFCPKVLIAREEYEILRHRVIATSGWFIALNAVVGSPYVSVACFQSSTFLYF